MNATAPDGLSPDRRRVLSTDLANQVGTLWPMHLVNMLAADSRLHGNVAAWAR